MRADVKKVSFVNRFFCIGAVVLSALAAALFLCLNIFFSTAKFSIAVSFTWLLFSVIFLLLSKKKFVFVLSIISCITAIPLLLIMAMLAPAITYTPYL